ncbi:PREDICTED: uncharacterized protein LOC109212893 [Nicotiana attenuata]|uniref:uncharacterized protein LOC109212893 n=1 Tax=Nicotiana attenuata TaxID=49451 RepID=UPI000904E302|nr:PREDICTED: uncharacterized protein LOC109212893 [Nicotiana attenuata]
MGASFKRMDEFRESQNKKLQEALDMGELEKGRGLNQELGLVRAGTLDDRAKASGYLEACQIYNVVFLLHLMTQILGITNELNVSLQKREQDIANDTLLVQEAKKRLQTLRRNDEWVPFVDRQFQQLNDRFDELTTDLLHGAACLDPIDSFSSFDIRKILKMTELYPDGFDEFRMSVLENQLASYNIDVRDFDERFSNLNGLSDLSKRLVKTKKHSVYPFVFLLVKLALLLPVATTIVERAFSAMKFIKNGLQSRMDDDFLGGCIVPYVEREVFSTISNESITKIFQKMKPHRVQL